MLISTNSNCFWPWKHRCASAPSHSNFHKGWSKALMCTVHFFSSLTSSKNCCSSSFIRHETVVALFLLDIALPPLTSLHKHSLRAFELFERFWSTLLNQLILYIYISIHIHIFFKKSFSKCFFWTRRRQFWQPCVKHFCQKAKKNYQTIYFFKIFFSFLKLLLWIIANLP